MISLVPSSDDGAADATSHAGPVRLGTKEGIEELVVCCGGSPTPVSLADTRTWSVSARRDLISSSRVLHRFDTLDHEVDQYLLQLHAISQVRCRIADSGMPESGRGLDTRGFEFESKWASRPSHSHRKEPKRRWLSN